MKATSASFNRIPALEKELAAALVNRFDPQSVFVYSEIDSTNDEAKRMACAGESEGDVLIVALHQTKGRGRLGRSFYSPTERGIYFSILHRTSLPPTGAVGITCAAAVAAMRGIAEVTGKVTDIKWVNDLYLDGKKVCGILTEAVACGTDAGKTAVIVGTGINLKDGEFPPELCRTAGTLGVSDDIRIPMVAAVCRHFSPFMHNFGDRTWLADYRAHSLVLGKEIVWVREGRSFSGKAIEIGEDGALLVRTSQGEYTSLNTGEISVRLPL